MIFLRIYRFSALIFLAVLTLTFSSYANLYSNCNGPTDDSLCYTDSAGNHTCFSSCGASSLLPVPNPAPACEAGYTGICQPPNSASGTLVCPGGNASSTTHAVGWGYSCQIPAGDVYPSDTSCITIPNLIGEVIDIVTTIGIGIDMFQNYCSFSAGGMATEGALINQSFLDQCSFGTPVQQKQCQAQLLRGYHPPQVNQSSSIPYNSSDLNPFITSNLCDAAINLERPVYDSNLNFVFNGNQQVFCPLMRCNVPTKTMLSLYYDRVGARTAIMAAFGGVIGATISALEGNCADLVELGNGDSASVALFGFVELQGQVQGDMICTEMLFPTGYSTVACKPLPIPVTQYPGSNNCLIQNSSCASGEIHAQSFFPFTARMMECVNDLVGSLFTSNNPSCPSALSAFQTTLRSTVQMVLVLYVVIFGINLVMGSKVPNKSEFFVFILKFALVGYFAVGVPGQSANQSGLYLVYQIATSAMNSFSNIVIGNDYVEGGPVGAADICNYSVGNYQNGYDYLALWDALDCRLAFYLGLANPVTGGALQAATSNMLSAGLFSLIWSMMFSFYFPLMVFMLCFGIFLLSVVIYFVHVYILALFAIAVLIFVGPIFIPMALFDRTKGYFSKWLELIMAYALYPVVITAFISIMIVTYDQIIYDGCVFSSTMTPYGFYYWTFDSPNSTCQQSFGYILSQLTSSTASEITQFAGGLFNFTRLIQGASVLEQLLKSMMTCGFLGFLFYYFSKELSHFAADITGATNLGGHAISPTAVADGAASAASALTKKDDVQKGDADKGDGVDVSKNKGRDGVSVSSRKGGGSSKDAGSSDTDSDDSGIEVDEE
jgi:type IV secretion system protein VirB6